MCHPHLYCYWPRPGYLGLEHVHQHHEVISLGWVRHCASGQVSGSMAQRSEATGTRRSGHCRHEALRHGPSSEMDVAEPCG
jgi:hypothetical protein